MSGVSKGLVTAEDLEKQLVAQCVPILLRTEALAVPTPVRPNTVKAAKVMLDMTKLRWGAIHTLAVVTSFACTIGYTLL